MEESDLKGVPIIRPWGALFCESGALVVKKSGYDIVT